MGRAARMIIDASVVAAAFLPDEAWSQQALAMIDGVLLEQTESAVPSICWVEVAHSLVRASRRGRLDVRILEVAEEGLAGLIAHVPTRDVDAVSSMSVALDLGLGVYDSSYLVLSRSAAQPLVTVDRRLWEVATKAGYDVVWLGAAPLP